MREVTWRVAGARDDFRYLPDAEAGGQSGDPEV